jgi:hypothetical protein
MLGHVQEKELHKQRNPSDGQIDPETPSPIHLGSKHTTKQWSKNCGNHQYAHPGTYEHGAMLRVCCGTNDKNGTGESSLLFESQHGFLKESKDEQ